jgi:hypothetical protein
MPVPPSPSSAVAIDRVCSNPSPSSTPAKPTKAKGAKGGMAANPFGGFPRLDRIDLLAFASGTDSPQKMLYLATIKQALAEYLFYGLGRNGTTAAEFYFAHEYFFEVRSTVPETWGSRIINAVVEESGKRRRRIVLLSDSEMGLGCFDVQYGISQLDKGLPFDRFVTYLEQQRITILTENWDQVRRYLCVTDANEDEMRRELVHPTRVPAKAKRISRSKKSFTELAVAA